MRLTNQQITTIEQTLVLNGVVYDDIKLELLDHIATEIESIIDESQFSFEENLKKVFAKWKNELTPSSSFWIRNNKSIPKIVIQKSIKMIQHVFLMSFCLGLGTAVAITLIFKNNANQEVLVVLNTLLRAMALFGVVFLIYAKFRLWQSKQESTYSYLFNQNGFLQVINLVLIATGLFRFKGNTAFFDFHFMSTFFPITLLFISWFYLNIAFKHIKFENKINMI
jgi:hypothetical protein